MTKNKKYLLNLVPIIWSLLTVNESSQSKHAVLLRACSLSPALKAVKHGGGGGSQTSVAPGAQEEL